MPELACPADEAIETAARWLLEAEALVVGSGAGMGVDAGLRTFRGRHAGVWGPLVEHGLDYSEVCQPRWFEEDPAFAWAFWGYCGRSYRRTPVHGGYAVVQRWAERYRGRGDAFVYTTNIDGHWRKAGWPERALMERHGHCGLLQCSRHCSEDAWPCTEIDLPPLAAGSDDRADEARLPRCTRCGALARPNVLMFHDAHFAVSAHQKQALLYKEWLQKLRSKNKFRRRAARSSGRKPAAAATPEPGTTGLRGLLCVEIGAGTTLPTVRHELERLSGLEGARLIRFNPEEPEVPERLVACGRAVSVPLGALEGLLAVDVALRRLLGEGGPPASPTVLLPPNTEALAPPVAEAVQGEPAGLLVEVGAEPVETQAAADEACKDACSRPEACPLQAADGRITF